MPQPRKHDTPAARQAAYRARTEAARSVQLAERGLPALPSIPTMQRISSTRAPQHSQKVILSALYRSPDKLSSARKGVLMRPISTLAAIFFRAANITRRENAT